MRLFRRDATRSLLVVLLAGMVAAHAHASRNTDGLGTLRAQRDAVAPDAGNVGHLQGDIAYGEADTGGPRILYCPSEDDDAGYRAQLAAQIGGICQYYDARLGTPDAGALSDYFDCVMTWVNYAYFDKEAMGDNLADFVDSGGHVVLGAFCAYTSGNFLAGRIMSDPDYCPVSGGFNHFSLSFWDGTDAACCVHTGITSYGTTYRDYLTLDGPGASICGRYQDGEIANAVNSGGNVLYANGAGGYPLGPVGQDAARAGNGCACGGAPTAAQPNTWGAVKTLYQ